jgi:hypothetical protein
MMNIPKLSKEALQVLDALLERSNIPGGELMRRAGVKRPKELFDPIVELQKADLIRVGGDASKEATFPLATFGILPSAKDYLKLVVQHNR